MKMNIDYGNLLELSVILGIAKLKIKYRHTATDLN